MKKLLFVVLTLMAVSLMVAAPALAKRPSGDECAHDVATVEALRDCVEHAIHHGHIDDPEVAFPHYAKTMKQYLAEAGVRT